MRNTIIFFDRPQTVIYILLGQVPSTVESIDRSLSPTFATYDKWPRRGLGCAATLSDLQEATSTEATDHTLAQMHSITVVGTQACQKLSV